MNALNLTKDFFDFEIFVTPDTNDLPELSGKNQKKLLVVVEKSDYTTEASGLLVKIIQAVGFQLAEDALLLQLERDTVISAQSIRLQHEIDYLISFGIPLVQLGIHLQIPAYQISKHGDIQLLLADKLEHTAAQKSAKAALWKALQAMFPK